MWYIILHSILDATNHDLVKKYRTIDIKLKKLEKTQGSNHEFQEQFYLRVVSKTDIIFSNDELSLLKKGLKYNLSNKHKKWFETLALEAKTAVSYSPTAEQDYIRCQVAHNVRQLNEQYKGSHEYNTIHMKRGRHTLNKIKDKLQMNKTIISKADEGHSIVITYQNDYHKKILDFITNYSLTTVNNDPNKT
jgi:hypothetical protein